MTIVRVSENSLKGVSKWKNEEWERTKTTPNEAYRFNADYKKYVDGFANINRVSGPHKFFEIRIVNRASLLHLPARFQSRNWFENPNFMDRCFWVFHKPVEERVDGKPFLVYVLEPKECIRVHRISNERLGIPFPKGAEQMRAFVVPVDSCIQAWTETANGVSEHIHYRPEAIKTQQEIDREAEYIKVRDELLAEAFDVPLDSPIAIPNPHRGK